MSARASRLLIGSGSAALAIGLGALPALVVTPHAVAAPKDKVVVCHTGNGTNYTVNEPAATADVGGHDGHDGDIIPPFAYDGGTYAGKNWDAAGQDVYHNGACDGDGI